jgi:hypothetical protein
MSSNPGSDPESGSAIRKNVGSGFVSGSALNQCGSATLLSGRGGERGSGWGGRKCDAVPAAGTLQHTPQYYHRYQGTRGPPPSTLIGVWTYIRVGHGSLWPELRIRDVYPGSRILIFSSRILIKEYKYFKFYPKKWFPSSRKYDPGCSSRIRIPNPDLDFLLIPDPGVKKLHPIPYPNPQHCFVTYYSRVGHGG